MQRHRVFDSFGGVPIKAWINGVHLEDQALAQLLNVAQLPIVHQWVAAMPDVHWGLGATIGSVIPTIAAVIPAAVGVDIGCGMMAVETSLRANDLPDDLKAMRSAIERAVPHGSSPRRSRDKGSWSTPPSRAEKAWAEMEGGYQGIIVKHSKLDRGKHIQQLGTLGGGNHFIEVCLDEAGRVWIMLHSGSRGVGNRIGTYFIELAKKDMERQDRQLPDKNLSYFSEGSEHFGEYVEAVEWAQGADPLRRHLYPY